VKQKTLVLIKPGLVKRGLVGEILGRFEKKGFDILAMKMVIPGRNLIEQHYRDDRVYLISVGENSRKAARRRGENTDKWNSLEFGGEIRQRNIDSLSGNKVVAMVLEGDFAISQVRLMIGSTEPLSAQPGTIRGDFCLHSYLESDAEGISLRNGIHASDSEESSAREINLWFPDLI